MLSVPRPGKETDNRSNWVEAGGAALRYRIDGSGNRTLVLLHEMGGMLESWDDVVPALQDLRIVRYDWRGAGLSEKATESSLEVHAADLGALLDALEIHGPVYLAGCAVGAAIALRFASLHPERVSGVVGMCPATKVLAEKRPAGVQVAERVAREGMGLLASSGLTTSYPEAVRHDIDRYNNYLLRFRSNDPVSFGASLKMVSTQEGDDWLKDVTAPALILAGAYDGTRPPELVREVADKIPGATFRIVESGHVMHYQTPDLIVNEIGNFLTA